MARKFSPTTQKVLLLLMSGASLCLTRSPKQYFKITKLTTKAWKEINRKKLQETIRNLYRSHLIDMKENHDGTIQMVLTEEGKKKILLFNLEEMKINIPKKWDGKWRLVTFDIPEDFKKSREALRQKLKNLGFSKYQKSVFVYPYECKNEIDFVIEFFNLRSYVRYIIAEHLDNGLDFKRYFRLL